MINALPIPQLRSQDRARLVALVEKILAAKEHNPLADTPELDKEINRVVYDMCDLTLDEIAIVESGA